MEEFFHIPSPNKQLKPQKILQVTFGASASFVVWWALIKFNGGNTTSHST
jgi:hypothetical protein